MLFSIIVPVYNIEKYITKCIESILAQKYGNYELILVDDGSKDDSGAICDEYAQKYSNVFVHHKTNGGLSDARNFGVCKANGKYIIFVDGDDWVSTDMLSNMHEAIDDDVKENSVIDVILSEGQFYTNEVEDRYELWFDKKTINGLTGIETLRYTTRLRANWAAFGKAFRKQFWIDNNFQFVKHRLCEDIQLIDKVIIKAQRVAMISGFYHYVSRSESIVHNVNSKLVGDMITNFEEWNKFLDDNVKDITLSEQIMVLHAECYAHAVLAYVFLVNDRDDLLKRAKGLRYLIKFIPGIEGNLIRLFNKVLGFDNTCRLLSIIKGKRLK